MKAVWEPHIVGQHAHAAGSGPQARERSIGWRVLQRYVEADGELPARHRRPWRRCRARVSVLGGENCTEQSSSQSGSGQEGQAGTEQQGHVRAEAEGDGVGQSHQTQDKI